MKFALVSIASATLFFAGVSAQSLTVNTPVHPGAAPDDPALADFGTQQGTSFTWTAVNFPAGTSLDITLRDSAGLISQTAPFTVQTSTNTACLNASASSSSGGSTSPTPASTTTATGSTPSVSTPTTSATTPTASATTKPSSSPASSSSKASSTSTPSSSSNAAMPTGVSYGAAGVIGAVVAAVLA
ncbi:hypothetical protein EDB92DRAFT_1943639 [Lactarius akahatsu]|uniref:Uncharacterized protein n=1 Tax=Lactarius akahatsu TaxID=416441 RepID=A0AAD4QCI5_9AGAM|nr:hypothetical protein EDB92DRAFT_1943639 [Lactarius akahatsu]